MQIKHQTDRNRLIWSFLDGGVPRKKEGLKVDQNSIQHSLDLYEIN